MTKNSDESFFTGTAAEVTPIIQVDDTIISNGVPGSMTKKDKNEYFNLIRGKTLKYDHWAYENLIMFKKKNILVVGDIMLDKYSHGNVTRISPGGSVPIVDIKKTIYKPGGASNVAQNLSALV